VYAWCGGSNKTSRTAANRYLRHANRIKLDVEGEEDDYLPYLLREKSDTYDFATDGLPGYSKRMTHVGRYLGLISEVEEMLNGKGDLGGWFWHLRYLDPEGLLHFLKLPVTMEALEGVTNEQMWRYAGVIAKKDAGK
jgi:hypothetical protein